MTTTMMMKLCGMLTLVSAAHAQAPAQAPAARRPIDVALCLDTSGSMNGLLDAARQNLWAIVNDLAQATPAPALRVALLTFGNNGHQKERGWVHVDQPLTDDLDAVSRALFALTTNGGEEYVARVVRTAVDELAWSQDAKALRLLIVAGNEAATQDPELDGLEMAGRAIERGILVDSIYCGNPADTLAPGWRAVAVRADGQFAAIDKDQATVVIATPFDARLAELSTSLNPTYLPFGKKGVEACENQTAQDENAAKLNPQNVAQRAYCKSWYSSSSWDLVDALAEGKVELDKIPAEELPEAMRAMTLEQKQAHVAAMGKQRKELEKEIAELHLKREKFVVEERRRQSLDGKADFEFAVRSAARSQAEAKGFAFPPPPVAAAAPVPAEGTVASPAQGTGK
jgi:hypothetical protein